MAAAALMLANPPQAAARSIAQGCPVNSSDETTVVTFKQYAESFTAARTGKLTYAEFYGYRKGTFTLEIWKADSSGRPTGIGPLASTQAFVEPALGSDYDRGEGTFASPAAVRGGRNYALVVTVPNADDNGNGVRVRSGNPCPGAFSENKDGTPGQFALDNYDMEYGILIKFRRHR